jgi:hypothetical protein
MHESMAAFRRIPLPCPTRLAMAVALIAAILLAGCNGPLRHLVGQRGCGQECECGEACCEPPVCDECGLPPCTCGLPHYSHLLPHGMCGHAKSMCHLPTHHCGCLLHFCDHSDYVGPIEPPRRPRFSPVPTHPVFAEGLTPVE